MPPGPENTTPDTTPYAGGEIPPPSATPDMTDDAIRDELRKWYVANAEVLQIGFRSETDDPSLDSYKAYLKDFVDTDDEAFKPRYDAIESDVVDEIAGRIYSSVDPLAPRKSADSQPSQAQNVEAGADPVDLFNGEFVYSTADFHVDGAGMDFVFMRTYSQMVQYEGPLGYGWDHGYNLRLQADPDGRTVRRSNGRLGEETFRRHELYDYWIPPDGIAGVLVASGGSFVFRRADGARVVYRPHPTLGPFLHVAARIEDRFGNFLAFSYDDGLLARVEVNGAGRLVHFDYDSQRRIVRVRDFTGRAWRYEYDSAGDLVAVTTPRRTTSRYEYTGVFHSDPKLQHNLTSILDADGRLFLENEYGTERGLLSYCRVVGQRQGGGDVTFDYADVVEDFPFPYDATERPAHQTIVTERDGRQLRHLFNARGNLVFREEYARLSGLPKLISSHYRYNRDGNLVGSLSPLGVLAQAYHGRDRYERRFPREEGYRAESDPNLTAEARLQFDQLLAVVHRGRYHDAASLSLARGLWSRDFFPDVLQASADDTIQKFTYEPELGQVLTISDPRFTRSADPDAVEDAAHQRHLTRYSWAPGLGFQHLRLQSVELPAPTLPDGTVSAPVLTQFPSHDANGRVLEVVGPNGLRTVHEYSPAGYLVSTTVDPDGFHLEMGFERDALGRIVRLRRPPAFDFDDGRFESTNEYDELSRVVRSVGTAPFSIETRHAYTRAGALARSETQLKDHDNVLTGSFVAENQYDEELNVVAQTIGDASATKRSKVLFDRASRAFLTISPSGRKRKKFFDERSIVSKVIDDYGGVHAVTRGTHDADGRLVRYTDPRGNVTRFTYDTRGRMMDSEDALGNRVVRHYDKLDNVLVECIFEKRAHDAFVLLRRCEYRYDELGRRIVEGVNKFENAAPVAAGQLRDAFRASGPGELLTIQSFFDSIGNLVQEIDQDGREFVSHYDLLGRLTRRIGPFGNEVGLTYDKEGNILRVDRRETATRHFADSFTHDEMNRIVERRTTTGRVRYRYDSRGNQSVVEDPLGNRFESDYDVFDRPIETREAGVRTRFTYDLEDRKTAQTDALGRTTRFAYDSAGRLSGVAFADGTSDAHSYDRMGNLTEYRDANGLIRRFTWDGLNRSVGMRVDASQLPADAPFAGAVEYACAYDALHRFTAASNELVSEQFTYNSLDHPLTEVTSLAVAGGAVQFTTRRQFTNTGALRDLVYPSGRAIRYSRDVLDRVTGIEQTARGSSWAGHPATPDGVALAAVTYEGLQTATITRPNGIPTAFRYDFAGRTVEIAHGDVLTQQYLYDRLGNMIQRTEVSAGGESTERFRYDARSRLFEAARSDSASLADLSPIAPASAPLPDPIPDRQPEIEALLAAAAAGRTTAYEYDSADNRRSTTTDGVPRLYEPNAVDQYERIGLVPRRHDANGNLIEDEACFYFYDHRNQLTGVRRKADGQETRFVYDFFGRRLLEGTDSVTLYEGHNVLEQRDGAQLVRSVVTNTNQDGLVASSSGGTETQFLADLTGSVRAVFEGVQQRAFYLYDEFGNPRNAPAPGDENPFRYAGKRLIADTGKYDFAHRVYDPAAGRFLQRDPKNFVDGTNLYAYARNNPLVLTDRLGLESRTEVAGELATGKAGAELIRRNPTGFTVALDDNVDDAKIRAYKERIQDPLDRGVGIRSRLPGQKTSTQDLRAQDRRQLSAWKRANGGSRAGQQIDHVVELQHVVRQTPGNNAPGANRVRPQDYRYLPSGPNASQGSRNLAVKQRQVRAGAPLDTSAGGVARERDLNKLTNRQGFRTGGRFLGLSLSIGSIFSALSDLADDIRNGHFGNAALNTSAYLGGALELGGILARSPVLLRYARFAGAPAAVVASGVVGWQIGRHLSEKYVDHERANSAGEWVEEKTGSRILGAAAAAYVATWDATAHIPEAAWDEITDTWTLDPDEIDWDRTLKPWKW
ncbi:MAG TPA: RHS repeat-associated core domain-containing protein [Thermoanaerobaculia bacterium]|nr:RHS repeat-associated core domain-containing protein [Thermoanaerobaculia bacterium]